MSKKLKLKIILTNIKRVIMSILFVNLSFGTKVFAIEFEKITRIQPIVTCYATHSLNEIQPINTTNTIYTLEHVFIILVPIALIIGLIIYRTKKLRIN